MFQPDISVVIAAYNAADSIERAIQSVLRQEGVSVEVIVVDDCSTDTTVQLTAALDDPRIVLIRRQTNGGPSAARNLGFDVARGPLIAVLDADDYILPGRLRHLRHVAEHNKADIVADNLITHRLDIDKQELFLDNSTWREPLAVDLALYMRENTVFRKGRQLGYLKPIFRTDFLRSKGLRYDETLWVGEDFRLVAEALAFGARFLVSPDAGYVYTTARAGSVSNRLTEGRAASLLSADDTFRSLHAHRMSARELKAARFRRKTIEDTVSFLGTLNALKAMRFGPALKILAKNPRSVHLFRLPVIVRLRAVHAAALRFMPQIGRVEAPLSIEPRTD